MRLIRLRGLEGHLNLEVSRFFVWLSLPEWDRPACEWLWSPDLGTYHWFVALRLWPLVLWFGWRREEVG